jgi:hypothetical protein
MVFSGSESKENLLLESSYTGQSVAGDPSRDSSKLASRSFIDV